MVYVGSMLFMSMCIELFVHKVLVYSDCASPSPSEATPVAEDISTPTSNTSAYHNTTSQNGTSTQYTPLPDNSLMYAAIAVCAVLPCLLWCICAFYKKTKVRPLRRKKRRRTNKVCEHSPTVKTEVYIKD